MSDWAKWSTLGTLLSAAVALVAVGVAIATQRRQIDESRRRQAARVLCYVYREPDGAALVRVENRSDLPIFDVMSLPLKMVAEKLGEIENINFYQGRAIEANDHFEKRVHDVSDIIGHLSADELWVEFTDAAGRRWRRSTSGLLADKGRDASRWQSARWQKGTARRSTAAGAEAEAGTIIDAAAQAAGSGSSVS